MMQEPKKRKPPTLPIKHTPPPPFIDGIRGNETGHTYTFEGMKMPWHSEDKPFGWSQAAWEGWLRALGEQENRWRDYEWDEWE